MSNREMLKRKEDTVQRPLIMVVDDESSIRSTLASVLDDENFDTITANDGVDALEKISQCQPDVVFLDIWMPGWDGIETLEKIKQVAPDSEVVMMSGHATISTALDAMKLGAADFIEKPFDIESVVGAAARALDRRQRSLHSRDASVDASSADLKNLSSGLASHPGLLSDGWKGRNLGQRTLKESVILYGQGLHTGMKSGLVLEPLPLNSGLHFTQMGISRPAPIFVDSVDSTTLATTVRSGTAEVSTIEHLMSALHAFGVSNLLIKCNGEVPIFDGSAEQFCSVIESVGIEEQGGDWFEIAVQETLEVSATQVTGIETLTIAPADTLSVSYELSYPDPVGSQSVSVELDSVESFRKNIASARTFGFMKDVERLYKAGLGAGARLDNFILIGDDGVLNTKLRFDDELARHKILDIVGDLFLIGRPLRGAITAKMTGHSDNISLLRKIREHAVT